MIKLGVSRKDYNLFTCDGFQVVDPCSRTGVWGEAGEEAGLCELLWARLGLDPGETQGFFKTKPVRASWGHGANN